jgi:hypothetical protein
VPAEKRYSPDRGPFSTSAMSISVCGSRHRVPGRFAAAFRSGTLSKEGSSIRSSISFNWIAHPATTICWSTGGISERSRTLIAFAAAERTSTCLRRSSEVRYSLPDAARHDEIL